MLQTHPKVLIVGAGPTGLVLACELRRYGIPCRIVDQADAPTTITKALSIHARTLELFSKMGIADMLLAGGRKIQDVSLAVNGRSAFTNDFRHLDTPYPYLLILPQHRTEYYLREQLQQLGGQVEWGVKCTQVSQDTNQVTVQLQTANGQNETVTTDWLVGCDGGHSTIRKQMQLPFVGIQYNQRLIIADVKMQWERDAYTVRYFVNDDWFIMIVPQPNGIYRLATTISNDVFQETVTTDSVQALLELVETVDVVVEELLWTASTDLHAKLISDYRVGRTFLAGDSAHLWSPNGGVGLNTCVQDAYNLAWKLAMVLHGTAVPTLLDSYNTERRAIAATALKRSGNLGKLLSGLDSKLRDQLSAKFFGKSNQPKRQSIDWFSGLTIHYRHSPIVQDDKGTPDTFFDPAVRAGDRAPDVQLTADGLKLFDLWQQTDHLFLFVGQPIGQESHLQSLIEQIQTQYAHINPCFYLITNKMPMHHLHELPYLIDPESTFHERYQAEEGDVYLIRPDGYVGYRGRWQDSHLLTYLAALFCSQEESSI